MPVHCGSWVMTIEHGKMKTDFSPAYILHRRSYRETSLLLDVLSRDAGRISLIAKGAKREKSSLAGLLQPCQRLLLSWSGNSELMTLTGAEADKPFLQIGQKRLIPAFYLNELVVRLLHRHESHPELFVAYDKALAALADEIRPEQGTIRKFEKRLLQAIGYGPVFDHDVDTGKPVESGRDYFYQADHGPVSVRPSHADFIKINGTTLIGMKEDALNTDFSLREAKRLMRYLLQKHLGDKPLASRDLYKSYMNVP